MKFKYILTALVAASLGFVGCNEKFEISSLEGVEISSSVVGFATEGGTKSITLNADQAWQIKDEDVPAWLSIQPVSGGAGQTTISLTATANTGAQKNDQTVITFADGKTQIVKLLQDGGEPTASTCAQVIAGDDGVAFKVTGTVTGIANTHYGNFYINDGTGEVYIYGTMDKKGNTNSSSNSYDNLNDPNNANSWDISVGDVVTVQGPKKKYNDTHELVDVAILGITKSLLTIVGETEYKVDKEDNTIDVKVVYKGNDLQVNTDACWLTLAGIDVQKDTTFVKLHVAANAEDTRTAEVTFSSNIPGQASSASITVTQATGLSMYTLPFVEDFQAGQGAFEINDIVARADGKDIWAFASGYGMKATGGSKVDTKSMLISPKISLAGVASPVLTFEHCGKYCGDQAEELTVWASTDGGETWAQLLIPNEHPNNWGWVNSGEISLAKFVGKDYIQVAFQYISNASFYGTWEVKNLKIEDRALQMTSLAELSNAATSASVEYTVNLKDAIVTYVNGSNAFIQDATGAVQVYSKTHGLVAGDVFNGPVKFTQTLYSGYQEATAIDFSAATKTTGTVEPIVLTVDKLNKDYTRYTCCLVKIEGATFATGSAGTAKVNDTMSQDGASVATRTQVNAVAYEAGKAYDVVCVPVRYNSAPQVSIYETPVAK